METSTVTNAKPHTGRSILPCNFRSAGRLSNESTRHLRTLHETFARNASHALDLFLGSPLDIKLVSVSQIESRDFTASLLTGNYLVPFAILPMQGRIVAKFDASLLFPLLDVLLGGTGEPHEGARELTEIDEELIRSVTEILAVQLERVWKACNVAVAPAPSIKPALIGQIFATEERVLQLRFEIVLGSTTGALEILLPMAFSNALVRMSQSEATRRGTRESVPARRLRDRVLDCTMLATADLSGLRVPIGDLVELQPGAVLNLRAPVGTPVRLSVGGYTLFDVTPVRRGNRKAAQLGQPHDHPTGD